MLGSSYTRKKSRMSRKLHFVSQNENEKENGRDPDFIESSMPLRSRKRKKKKISGRNILGESKLNQQEVDMDGIFPLSQEKDELNDKMVNGIEKIQNGEGGDKLGDHSKLSRNSKKSCKEGTKVMKDVTQEIIDYEGLATSTTQFIVKNNDKGLSSPKHGQSPSTKGAISKWQETALDNNEEAFQASPCFILATPKAKKRRSRRRSSPSLLKNVAPRSREKTPEKRIGINSEMFMSPVCEKTMSRSIELSPVFNVCMKPFYPKNCDRNDSDKEVALKNPEIMGMSQIMSDSKQTATKSLFKSTKSHNVSKNHIIQKVVAAEKNPIDCVIASKISESVKPKYSTVNEITSKKHPSKSNNSTRSNNLVRNVIETCTDSTKIASEVTAKLQNSPGHTIASRSPPVKSKLTSVSSHNIVRSVKTATMSKKNPDSKKTASENTSKVENSIVNEVASKKRPILSIDTSTSSHTVPNVTAAKISKANWDSQNGMMNEIVSKCPSVKTMDTYRRSQNSVQSVTVPNSKKSSSVDTFESRSLNSKITQMEIEEASLGCHHTIKNVIASKMSKIGDLIETENVDTSKSENATVNEIMPKTPPIKCVGTSVKTNNTVRNLMSPRKPKTTCDSKKPETQNVIISEVASKNNSEDHNIIDDMIEKLNTESSPNFIVDSQTLTKKLEDENEKVSKSIPQKSTQLSPQFILDSQSQSKFDAIKNYEVINLSCDGGTQMPPSIQVLDNSKKSEVLSPSQILPSPVINVTKRRRRKSAKTINNLTQSAIIRQQLTVTTKEISSPILPKSMTRDLTDSSAVRKLFDEDSLVIEASQELLTPPLSKEKTKPENTSRKSLEFIVRSIRNSQNSPILKTSINDFIKDQVIIEEEMDEIPASPVVSLKRKEVQWADLTWSKKSRMEDDFLNVSNNTARSPGIFRKKTLGSLPRDRVNIDTQHIDQFNTETLHLVASGTKAEGWSSEGKISDILSEEKAILNANNNGCDDDEQDSGGYKKKKPVPKRGLRAELYTVRKSLSSERRVMEYERQKGKGSLPGAKEFLVLDTWGRNPLWLQVRNEDGEAIIIIAKEVIRDTRVVCNGCSVKIFPPWDILNRGTEYCPIYQCIRTCEISYNKQLLPISEKSYVEMSVDQFINDPNKLICALIKDSSGNGSQS